VPVVRQPVRERRAVVVDEFRFWRMELDRGLKGAVVAPEREGLLLEGRVARLRRHRWVRSGPTLSGRVGRQWSAVGRFEHAHSVRGRVPDPGKRGLERASLTGPASSEE
jgi:hypothetical protein